MEIYAFVMPTQWSPTLGILTANMRQCFDFIDQYHYITILCLQLLRTLDILVCQVERNLESPHINKIAYWCNMFSSL